MAFKAEDITETFEKLDLRAPQRSLPRQPSDGGIGNTNYHIGPNYIYAPGGPGGGGGGGGGGGLQVGGGGGGLKVGSVKATVSSETSGRKADIKMSTMPKEMEEDIVDYVTLAYVKYKERQEIENYIQDRIYRREKGLWHCIVGPNNIAYKVVPNTERYICLDRGDERIVLFKTQ